MIYAMIGVLGLLTLYKTAQRPDLCCRKFGKILTVCGSAMFAVASFFFIVGAPHHWVPAIMGLAFYAEAWRECH